MAMIIVTLLWVFVGFSLSFGSSIGGFIETQPSIFMFQNVNINTAYGTIPSCCLLVSSKFAIITPALITGAFAERIRFGLICYLCCYSFYLFTPLCHMTWHAWILLSDGSFRLLEELLFT
jgi:Amt family ammonium transporter